MIAALILAAVVFALLWPEERGSGAGRLRVAFFSLLAAAIGFALSEQYASRTRSETTGRAFQAYTEGLHSARSVYALEWSSRFMGQAPGAPPSSPRSSGRPATTDRAQRQAKQQLEKLRRDSFRAYERAVRLAPESTLFRRQYAILLADAGRREEALRQFRELAPEVEADLWERLYGPKPPGRAELPALVARLKLLRLGWFEGLALKSAYERVGMKQQAETAADAAGRRAAMLVFSLSAVVFGMIGAAAVGLVLLTVFFVRWRAGRLRPAPFQGCAGAAPLLEAFVLYLFFSVAPGLLEAAGVSLRPSQARSATRFLTLLFALDLVSLIAVGYLWARLRALGRGLSEVGLHAREWGRNIWWGIGGYVAALPVVFGSALLAGWLGRRFFPEVAPPFHPVQALTAVAPSGWVRFALLVAVAVAAPLLEELFFRGLLYGALRRRLGVAFGVIASAAVFSLLHPQLPLGFLPLFVMGVAFAILYEWRQSLIPGITMHALNNGVIWIALNLLFPPP